MAMSSSRQTDPATALDDAAAAFDVRLTRTPRPAPERAELLAEPRFGTVFSDHLAHISWTEADGWHGHRIEPYGPIAMDPAAAVLHYAQEIFEGLKAYRHDDGGIWAFRPEANASRFAASARRMALPELSETDFLGSVAALVRTDSDWVPSGDEMSLYLRPFMFASEPFLGVRPSARIEYMVIASPVGAYFSGPVKPVSIWVSQDYHRAGPGGTGEAKCGGNYAASLLPQQQAYQNGCDQVCFLDAKTDTNLEELGGMNVVVVHADGSVSTPRLTGSILVGVTRTSVLQLLRDAGREVVERDIPLGEVLSGLRDGSITEIFACGTAAVVTPIGRLAGTDFDLTVAGGEAGKITMDVREQLTDIQFGRAADRYGWMRRIA